MKKISGLKTSLAILGSLIVLASPATALAAKPSSSGGSHGGGGTTSTVQTGNDISWPQCGGRLPQGQLFGIVGVNNGTANTFNPCFTTQLAWANSSAGGTKQDKAALYVNTANPGDVKDQITDWPTSGATPYGDCNGANDRACSYEYGWQRAQADTQNIAGNSPANFKWWLDVETDNTWSSSTVNNAADLEGMTDYFTSVGGRVGLYSTAYQWNQLIGTVSSGGLYGLDSWLPGARSLSGARSNCSLPALTGGTVTLTQYVAKQTDYDYSCV
jgi:hypothetical protein